MKDRLALESMRTVDTVMFDKTGTLTEGAPAVTAIETASAWHDNDVLALAAAAENVSEHPLAAAIVRAAAERGIRVPQATDFRVSGRRATPGHWLASALPASSGRRLRNRRKISP